MWTNGAGGDSWAEAGSIASDVVFSQMLYTYDADSNVIETTEKDRALGDSPSATGPLGTPSAGVEARVSYTASFYDAVDRDVEDANAAPMAARPGASPPRPPTSPPARWSPPMSTTPPASWSSKPIRADWSPPTAMTC